jgi:hypothetical protein
MCKLGSILSKVGLASVLLSIIVMVAGWLFLNINVCIVAMFLMSIAAISFTICIVCNYASEKRKEKATDVNGVTTP